MPKTITRLRDLTPDQGNANKHTPRGTSMMQSSIEECGFGDSLTVDKHGVVISGNQRLETLADVGLDDPIVVQTDGRRPVVHQRVDLEASDPKAKRLALFSNRVGQVNLDWDADALKRLQDDGVSLAGLWGDDELTQLLAEAPVAPEESRRLADRFIVPPFSVLDARQGYWQDRKRAWLALGIESEIGRGGASAGTDDASVGRSVGRSVGDDSGSGRQSTAGGGLQESGTGRRPRGSNPPHGPTVTRGLDGKLQYRYAERRRWSEKA